MDPCPSTRLATLISVRNETELFSKSLHLPTTNYNNVKIAPTGCLMNFSFVSPFLL